MRRTDGLATSIAHHSKFGHSGHPINCDLNVNTYELDDANAQRPHILSRCRVRVWCVDIIKLCAHLCACLQTPNIIIQYMLNCVCAWVCSRYNMKCMSSVLIWIVQCVGGQTGARMRVIALSVSGIYMWVKPTHVCSLKSEIITTQVCMFFSVWSRNFT